MTLCPRCEKRGPPFPDQGAKSDWTCAFPEGAFVTDNWNCATMNELRWLVEDHPRCAYSKDQYAAAISLGDGDHIILGWYKSRGRTEQAFWLTDEGPQGPITLAQAEQAIAYAERTRPSPHVDRDE